MAIIVFDKNTLQISVRVNPSESFKPGKDISTLQEKALKVKKHYEKSVKMANELLNECNEWNKKNDKNYAKNLKEAANNLKK